jgi:hypothetical protein
VLQLLAGRLAHDLLPVQPRQVDVHQGDLRLQLAQQLQRLFPVRRLPHHLQVWLQHERIDHPLPEQRVIVHDHDGDFAHTVLAALGREIDWVIASEAVRPAII